MARSKVHPLSIPTQDAHPYVTVQLDKDQYDALRASVGESLKFRRVQGMFDPDVLYDLDGEAPEALLALLQHAEGVSIREHLARLDEERLAERIAAEKARIVA